jgi:hypothetical protein
MNRTLTPQDIETARRNVGAERTQILLRALEQNAGFVDAMSSETGREILQSCVNRLQLCVSRLISGTLVSGSEEDFLVRAEIRVLKDIMAEWEKIISNYAKNERKWQSASGRES